MKIIDQENFVDKAEGVIKDLNKSQDKNKLTTSQIRNFLSMTSDIYHDVMNLGTKELDGNVKSRISYLRARCAYEAGRDPSVMDFVKKSNLMEIIPSIADKKDYIIFSQYMESLVAWHKYYGSRNA